MLDLRVDTQELEHQLEGLAAAVEDWRRPLRAFRAYMSGQVAKQVRQAGKFATGGTARGVRWDPAPIRYRRTTDGQVVPIWGGVKRIGSKSWMTQRMRAKAKARGEEFKAPKGPVKGRLNSRKQKRVTPEARIFQGWTAKRLRVLMKKQSEDAFSITMGPPAPFKYLTRIRPWVYFTPEDTARLEEIIARYFTVRER